MNLSDALNYQDSLTAVASGTFTTVQAQEANAVITGLQQYLAMLSQNVAAINSVNAQLSALSPTLASKFLTSVNGTNPLPQPRVYLDASGNVVSATTGPVPVNG